MNLKVVNGATTNLPLPTISLDNKERGASLPGVEIICDIGIEGLLFVCLRNRFLVHWD
ncbi:hypothetical protein [Photobacterium leiognathi]|uniref:hypothetical protein n=1 Tax=Photobacterium leiognathi TaxID=553611 RepID=UPI002732C318|nr:hypothetical protein [Photobacterium leiognathi]